jgi:hypothetical protein
MWASGSLQNAKLKVGATRAAKEQRWQRRPNLEYDSGIQGRDGCEPNFYF